MLLRRCEDRILINVGDGGQERGDIAHRDCLKTNSDAQRSFPTDDIDEEERAHDGRDEFDDTEDRGCEKPVST